MLNFNDYQSKREVSLQRAAQLKSEIQDYLSMLADIETGFIQGERTAANQKIIRQYFGASEEEWHSFSWQMKNRITKPEILAEFLNLSDLDMQRLKLASSKVRWAVSPYYLSLIDFENFRRSPIFMQSIPSLMEIKDEDGKE
ncbi:MAG: lysine 2,3-aminomutase, partial [Syntrophomonadaceae bacterium]|nr:lysine 2,3-aminomutase [Syntrophomonadaceae bacterium]